MSRVLLTVAIAVAAAAAMLLLPMASDLNQIFPLQVLAQSNNATAATSITTNNITGLTPPGQTVVHRGIISSEEPAHLVYDPVKKTTV
jgi:hypothetical protein